MTSASPDLPTMDEMREEPKRSMYTGTFTVKAMTATSPAPLPSMNPNVFNDHANACFLQVGNCIRFIAPNKSYTIIFLSNADC